MKDLHIQIRIEQCLALAKASHCPRRKLAAVLIDPKRNVILADGYNGGPRGASGTLCKGFYCERDGLRREEFETRYVHDTWVEALDAHFGKVGWKVFAKTWPIDCLKLPTYATEKEAWDSIDQLVAANPPVKSGTRMERGCHHAEANVVCNVAAAGVQAAGAWLIVLAEPCLMCAKLIHHTGIAKVIVVDGGYLGGKAGVEYLRENGVEVVEIDGPQDPRSIV